MKHAKNPLTVLGLAALAIVLPSTLTQAHHSASAYNVEDTATLTGVIENLQWRNPHVVLRVEVENETGGTDVWPLETAGIQQLIADGWDRELLAPGKTVTVEYRPTKTGNPGGILRWITLADGRVLAADRNAPASGVAYVEEAKPGEKSEAEVEAMLAEQSAATLDDYLAHREEFAVWEEGNRPDTLPLADPNGRKGALDPDNLAAHEGVAVYDFTGVWQHRGMREFSEANGGAAWEFLPVPELTEKSKAIQADVLARREAGDATADPATLCYPHGLLRGMTRAGNMMLLQENTALFMVHRMNNDYRAVYWDGRDHVPADVRIDSYNGDSIARWEDDHLYVETIGFGQPLMYINPGIPIGKEGRIEERWRLINDGNTLEIEFRMTDPEHWVGEWVAIKLWDRIHGSDIAEANCILAQDGDLAIGG